MNEDKIVAVRTAQTGANGWGVNEEGVAYTLDGAQQAVAHTLTARYNSSEDGGGRGTPLTVDASVRRLTPTECARLQGFPEREIFVTIRACSESQKNAALAESRSLKSLGSAYAAIAGPNPTKSAGGVRFVEAASLQRHLSGNRHAAFDVRMTCGGSDLEIRSPSGSLLFAGNVAESVASRPPVTAVDFARLGALMPSMLDQTMPTGRAESRSPNERFTAPANGLGLVVLSASEMAERASDAVSSLQADTSTTSVRGSSSLNSGLNLPTLSSYVAHAIAGCIPGLTQGTDSFDVNLTLLETWLHGSDAKQYRALGNAVTTYVAWWLGKRVMAVEDALSKMPKGQESG